MGIVVLMISYCIDLVRYYVGNKYFLGGEMKRPWAAAAGGAAVAIFPILFSFTEPGSYVFTYTVAMLAAGLMIEGKIRTKVIRVIWLFCVFSFLGETTRIVYAKFIEDDKILHIANDISSLIVIALVGCILNRIGTRFSNRKTVFGVIYTVLILICLSIGFSAAAIQFMFEHLPEEMRLINLDYVSVVAFFSIVLLLVLILYVQMLFELLEKAAQTERNLKQIQSAYYQSLLDKEEETRRYRHDMHNHLLYIQESAKAEEAERTAEYVESLEKGWSKMRGRHYETGNMTLNILLNHYLADLEGVKISVTGMCGREMKIEETDLCTILSNLIQNAVEELKRQEEEETERFFAMEIRQGKENTRWIIRNSTRLKLSQNNQKLRSSKKDKKNHGIGLKNVRDTVEKYGGEFSLSADGKEFKAVVTMKM